MPGREVPKTFKIFCGNLASAATKDDLYYLFSRYGPVVEAVVMVGKFYGFVHMAYEEDGCKAICELRGYNLHGKAMAVEASINSKKATPFYKQNYSPKGSNVRDDNSNYRVTKAKPSDKKDRQLPPESYNTTYTPVVDPSTIPPSIQLPPPTYFYHPAFPTSSVSSSQPSSVGHTPLPLSRTSPRPDAVQGNESPMLKLQAVDANCNPILHDHTIERQEVVPGYCALCGIVFDEWQHNPKVLSCGHTFGYSCLVCLAQDGEVKCPSGCQISTPLNEASLPPHVIMPTYSIPVTQLPNSVSPSVSGISPTYLLQNGTHSPPPMVCCSCPKIVATESCSASGHQLIHEDQARDIIHHNLQTSLDLTLKNLKQTIMLRATMKERLEHTVLSGEKFLEELRHKVEGEELEEAVLKEHLADLTMANEALAEGSSLSQLVESFNQVQNYINIVNSQYNQCAAITAINNATDAIVIKLKQSALESVLSSLGFSGEEGFSMNSSLEEHAHYGNNANVLLLYMLSDLLSTRMLQLKGVDPHSPSQQQQQAPLSGPSPMHAQMASSSIAMSTMGNNLGLPTANMSDDKGHDVEKSQDINEHIRQMTEAIETGSLISRNDGIGVMSTGQNVAGANAVALSLGLSNLSLIGAEASENGNDNGDSLRDRKEPIPVSYLDAAKKPAKPQPSSEAMLLDRLSITSLRPSKYPRCWMELTCDGEPMGSLIFELRPDKAPKMCENFMALCTGRSGYGYKGTHFFRSGEGFLAGGDVENDDGTGGYSAFEKSSFEADLCPLKDEVGTIRFKGIGTTDKGRGMIGSQFMIWCTDRDFKKFSYSLVFGKVVEGMEVAKKAAAMNVLKVAIQVEDCGVI